MFKTIVILLILIFIFYLFILTNNMFKKFFIVLNVFNIKNKINEKKQQIIDYLKPFFRLYKQYVNKYLIYIVIATILMIITALTTAGIAYIVGPVINKVFVEKSGNLLLITCGILIGLYVIKTFSTYIQDVCLRTLCERVITDLRVHVFSKMIKMPMTNLDKTQSGRIMSMFLNDIKNVGENAQELFVTSIRDVVTVLFLICLVFYNNFLLACVAVLVYPFVFVPLRKITKKAEQSFSKGQNYLQFLAARLTDITNGMKTIKSYNTENLEIRNMKKLLINLTRTCLDVARKKAMASPSMELACGLSAVLVIFIGGMQVIHGVSDVGKFFSFFTALLMVHRPARSLSGLKIKLKLTSVSINRVFSFIDGLVIENLTDGEKPDLSNPEIKFENVNFEYAIQNRIKNDKKFTILKNINIDIKPKTKIALVGISGCGKSTIVSLMMKLYLAQVGKITFNGIDINKISLSYLRQNIAYIGQDNFLFDDTIQNNILYGSDNGGITKEQIENAINGAHVDFLKELKKGINENVGYNGSRFSLGQRQRIAIARAIIKNAPIVIFDEATSALDANTEHAIREMIFTEMKDKTIIIIAHRLSTIVGCDNIYVMQEGRIVEEGKHTELLEKQGLYSTLWKNLND